ncbi:MAG: alpha/beta hydrolase [Alteromonadaceae bacterium]|nr:alpha/beta hydrolase [Alteromonadaceae bacterium]
MIATLLFAHGAGADKSSEFMQLTAGLFREHQVDCRLFNFDYMDKAAELGTRRPPDRMPKLTERFVNEIAHIDSTIPLFIGGKSMGGRVASMLVEETDALGGVCFGYPFHPPGKPDKLRTEHLESLGKPLFIAQGDRDPFGKREEVESYCLSSLVNVCFIENGEHSFKTRKSDQNTTEQNMQAAVKSSVEFIKMVVNSKL